MEQKETNKRLVSLDALRGFDMFWIMSGEVIVHELAKATNFPLFVWMSSQLHHKDWNGFAFYDMIFPLFLFIAGVSMPYSFDKKMSIAGVVSPEQLPKAEKKTIYLSMLKRTIILMFLGMVVNGLFQCKGYELTRFASVLGRIGIAWFFAGILYLNFDFKKQIYWAAAILLGYYFAMRFIPVPGFGAGNLSPEGALSSYIDRLYLPGKVHKKVYDPEGILTTLPAIVTALLGVFTGTFLKSISKAYSVSKRLRILIISGITLMVIGLIWDYDFPINKRLWTSSFVCLVGGISILMFTLFHYIIDVKGFQKWTFPFVLIGSNSILIYVAMEGLVNFKSTAEFIFGGIIRCAPLDWQAVLLAMSVTTVQFLLLYYLYKKKIFLKI